MVRIIENVSKKNTKRWEWSFFSNHDKQVKKKTEGNITLYDVYKAYGMNNSFLIEVSWNDLW